MKTRLLLFVLWGVALSVRAEAPSELATALAIQGDPARGKSAYALCRGCHKADGAGRAEADYPQLAGQHARVLIKQMADTRSGMRHNPKMHPFIAQDVVTTEEVAHIAAYLASLPIPAGNGKGDGLHLERGKQLYVQDCAGCHGAQGEGDAGKFIPRVAGQHYSYLRRENKAIQSTSGRRRDANPDMVKVIRGYTDPDLAAVSDYISRLGPAP